MLLGLTGAGCASTALKGLDAQGRKVYLGGVPIEKTEAYQTFLTGPKDEISKQNYLFQRLKEPEAQKLSYYRDGVQYNWLQAYRGGKWLIRNRYEKGQDARSFIKNHAWHSEDTGQPYLVKYPDDSLHEGYYVLINELDLLEETAAARKNSAKG